MAKEINNIISRAVPFGKIDVDTDEIAPTDEALYVLNWTEAGDVFCILTRREDPQNVLDSQLYRGGRILFAGKNFGCGSSREHATQGTLARYDAVIAPSFAPIFGDNAYAIGLPVLQVSQENLQSLKDMAEKDPSLNFGISLEKLTITPDGKESIPLMLDEAKRKGFITGTWDERDRLTGNLENTSKVLANLSYVTGQY
ncbi:MAG: hypothetical protein WCK29_00430 [archaeon]